MREYLNALQYVLDNGVTKENRTNEDTLSVFGMQMRFDLQKGFPAVTTKKLAWKAVVSELLWFIEGSTDEKRLREILYNDRNTEKSTIWTANSNSDYWINRAKYEGHVGKIYGYQWRNFNGIDQLKVLADELKNNPSSRRHILTAWNPAELSEMCLPPCHVLSQFDVTHNKLSCSLYQRSCDLPLGSPFNIASYSLLTHMLAQCCNLQVGDLIYTLGDAHIYVNQIPGVIEQIQREPKELPTLQLNKNITNLFEFTMDDIKLLNYKYHPPIEYPFTT